MPKRRKLSQAELEVHQVLSPDDSVSTVSVAPTVPPSQEHVKILSSMRPVPASGSGDPQAPVTQDPITMDGMRALFGELTLSLVSGIKEAISERDRSLDTDCSDDESSEEEESPSELPTGLDSAPPLFGVDVNEPQRSSVPDDAVSLPLQGAARVDVPGGGAPACADKSGTSRRVLPDASLPRISRCPPVNWDPDLPTLAWAESALDVIEWSVAEREAIEKEFVTDPEYEHIFTAVPCPEDMHKAMKLFGMDKQRDYLLNRATAEDMLLDGQKDLCCSSRVLLDVISGMAGKKDMEETRNKLATVYQGMASNMCKTSRGRRELGRRFVPLDNAPALFKQKPSHFCLFGYGSLDEAIKMAKESVAVNKDLVIMPTKAQPPFRSFGSGAKSSWAWKNRSSTQKNYGKAQNRTSNFPKGQRGKGRHKRGSRGRRKSKAATQE